MHQHLKLAVAAQCNLIHSLPCQLLKMICGVRFFSLDFWQLHIGFIFQPRRLLLVFQATVKYLHCHTDTTQEPFVHLLLSLHIAKFTCC